MSDFIVSGTPEKRLQELGFTLPSAAGSVSNYEPLAQTGNLIYTSGQLPWIDGDLKFVGQLGKGGELSDRDGYLACQLSTLNAIAQLKEYLKDLIRVKKIVRVEGVLNVRHDPRWTGQPKALDGASDLINQVFQEKGAHSRMVNSNSAMPLDCASLIYLIVEID